MGIEGKPRQGEAGMLTQDQLDAMHPEKIPMQNEEHVSPEYDQPNLESEATRWRNAISNRMQIVNITVEKLKKTTDREERAELIGKGERAVEAVKEAELNLADTMGKRWPEDFGPGKPKRKQLDIQTRNRRFEDFL